jgi:hypothetical protein
VRSALTGYALRKILSVVLCVLGAAATVFSLFGMWHHITIGPRYGPGLELGVGALAVSAVCFCGAYWFAA